MVELFIAGHFARTPSLIIDSIPHVAMRKLPTPAWLNEPHGTSTRFERTKRPLVRTPKTGFSPALKHDGLARTQARHFLVALFPTMDMG